MERKYYLDKLIDRLAFLKSNIEMRGYLHLTDINIISENFFRDFLNLLYKYKLKNINFSEPNSRAIDLGDETTKVAIQVTSTTSIRKIKDTFELFIKNKLFEKYERLIIFNLTDKIERNGELIKHETFTFNFNKDVWDFKTIINYINNMELDELKDVCSFIENEISLNSIHIQSDQYEINSSNFVLLFGGDRLKLENYGKREIYLFGTKFDQGPPIMVEPRVIPSNHHYYLLSSHLEAEAHSKIGKNGEAIKDFEVYLADLARNEYIAKYKLLFVITNGVLTIHVQQMGVTQEKWKDGLVNITK